MSSDSDSRPEPIGGSNRGLGPVGEAARFAFIALYAVAVLAALGWLVTNIRRIPPGNRAVVMRFGAPVRVQEPGLLLAWPPPFEQIALVPAAERVLEQPIDTLRRASAAQSADIAGFAKGESLSDALAGSGYLLTGDTSVVQLQASAFYTVVDPYMYALQRQHLQPALERLFAAAAVTIVGGRELDAILVARPELVRPGADTAAQRERLRGDLVQQVNTRLIDLEGHGGGLGIRVQRVDAQASLPRPTVLAFTTVLTASQNAAREVASARTDRERVQQNAQREASAVLKRASSAAAERVTAARTETAAVVPLASASSVSGASAVPASAATRDPGLLAREYRVRIDTLFAKAGSVIAIDPRQQGQLILPGQ